MEDIEAGLQYLAAHYTDLGICSIAMPPLGCGNGGLDWMLVKPLMEQYLLNIPDLEVFVYEPPIAESLPSSLNNTQDAQFPKPQSDRRSALPASP